MTPPPSVAVDLPIPRAAVPALAAAAFASGISLRLTDTLLPLFAGTFEVSVGQAASVITSFAVAYGVSQLFFGPVGDRFGKYRVIAWACVACALTASLCGCAQTFFQLVTARLLAGATAAAIIPLSMAWLGDVVPYEDRQPVLARFLIGQIFGLSTGVFVGGIAADHQSWRAPFFVIAAGFALISVCLFALNRRLPEGAKRRSDAQGNPFRTMIDEFALVLGSAWARTVLVTVFLEGACLYGTFAFIATHLHLKFAIALSTAGSMVMLFGFGGLLFAVASRPLVRSLGEVGLCSLGGTLVATSLFAIGIAPIWWWAIPACFCMGLGFYMLHNTLQINATQMAPQRRGAAVSAFASCFFLGQAAGVAAIGALVAKAGTAPAISAGACALLIVALNFSRLRGRRERVLSTAVAD
jgi:predicted MFS family arabinose efflux permease